MRFPRVLLAFMGVLCAFMGVLCGVPAHAQVVLRTDAVVSGTTDASGGSEHLRGTLGQAVAGPATGDGYALGQGFWGGFTSVADSPTYVVNSTADPGDGICDATECTLREALLLSNETAPNDRIHFDIPGTGVRSIIPLTPLPVLTDTVFVDGYTQPGASPNTRAVGNDAVLLIELNGNGAAFGAFTIASGGSTVRGVVINRFDGNGPTNGFTLQTLGGNTIAGNWIGTSADGSTAQNNSRAGIYIENSAGNIIGGTAPADRNVILGSANPVIYDQGTGGGQTIQGNYVGTDAQGLVPLGQTGIYLSTANNLIGGTDPGAGNVISVTGRDGIVFSESGATANTVQGNYIGVGSDGETPLGVGTSVVIMRGSGNLIGGLTTAARNVLGGSTGVRMFGGGGQASDNLVQGNYIGVNAGGTALVVQRGGAGAGVAISGAAGNDVGGTVPGAGNVIAGFAIAGVRIDAGSAGNVVQGNRIGTDAAGTAALPNNQGVVIFEASGTNTIGGVTADARNVISGNAGTGIVLTSAGAALVQGNYIGVAVDGTTPLGNGAIGVDVSTTSGAMIGGTDVGAGNRIAHNGRHVSQGGVRIASGTGNAVLGNVVYANFGFGLDLGTDGATANDPGDPDEGPNHLQNTPLLDGVGLTEGGELTVTYRVDSMPENATYPLRVEFFRASSGKGVAFLGADAYSATDYAGCSQEPCAKSITFAPDAALTAADSVVATATDAAGNTGEFTVLPAVVPVTSEEPSGIPAGTVLHAPWPNPAAGHITLRYDLAASGPVRLAVYDVLGREVAELVDGAHQAGNHDVAFGTSAFSTGIYVVRLTVDGRSFTHRLVIVR